MLRCKIKLSDRGEKVKYIFKSGLKEFKFMDEIYDISPDCVYSGSFIPILFPSVRTIDYVQGTGSPVFFWSKDDKVDERPMKTIDDCVRSLNLFANIKKLDYLLYSVVAMIVINIILKVV